MSDTTTLNLNLPVSDAELTAFREEMPADMETAVLQMIVLGAEAFREAHDEHAAAIQEAAKKAAETAAHGHHAEDHDHGHGHGHGHDEMLSEAQHPVWAFSGGARKTAKGTLGVKKAGDILILRTPSGILCNPRAQKYPEAASFLTLAKAKGIHQVINNVDSNGDLIELIAKMPEIESGVGVGAGLDPDLKAFVLSHKETYDNVRENSENDFAHYRAMGVDLQGTFEEKMQQAVAMEIAILNEQAATMDVSVARLVSVFDNAKTGARYVLNPESGQFVQVPLLDDPDEDVVAKRVLDFKAKLPQGQEWTALRGGYHIAGQLASAYTNEKINPPENEPDMLIAVSSCSDSRTHVTTVIGIGSFKGAFVYRVAGASLTNSDGKLTGLAKVFLALAKRRGVVNHLHAHHGDCGAMGVIYDYASGKTDFAGAPGFAEMAEKNKGLYAKVLEKGLDHYRGMGVELVGKTERDHFLQAMAVQRALDDYAVVKEKGLFKTTLIFQNTPAVQAYALNENTGKFVKIPQAPSRYAGVRNEMACKIACKPEMH